MTTIFYAEPELVIALNRKIIFVNPNDLQIFKEILIAEDLTQCGLKALTNNDDETPTEQNAAATEGECEKEQQPAKQSAQISNVKMAPNGLLLAVTTQGQKAVLLYQLRPEHAKLISVRPLARASSALAFDADSKRLLVTDKSGDCYEYDCDNLEAKPRLLLGHLSIVFDVLWSQEEQHIITCDRDDKIKVTNYPQTHDIHVYCLGHREFVAGMALLKANILLSVSGDQTLKLWNYLEGTELANLDLPAPGIKLELKQVGPNDYEAAVLLHRANECVAVYEICQNAQKEWQFKEKCVLDFPDMVVANLCFGNQQRLYVTGLKDEKFSIAMTALAISTPAPDNWLEMVNNYFTNDAWQAEDVSAWFKKRYDNVSEYLERKKRRIEENKK